LASHITNGLWYLGRSETYKILDATLAATAVSRRVKMIK
jgi:hypothetical protein